MIVLVEFSLGGQKESVTRVIDSFLSECATFNEDRNRTPLSFDGAFMVVIGISTGKSGIKTRSAKPETETRTSSEKGFSIKVYVAFRLQTLPVYVPKRQ